MAKYTIDINFNDVANAEEIGYKSSFAKPDKIDDEAPQSFGQFVKGAKAFATAIPGVNLVKSAFDWQISLVGRYTGSQQAQNVANASMKIAAQAGGLAFNLATGNYIGAALTVGATIFGYAKEAEENRYERKWENISNHVGIERAGASYNRSRIG